MYIVVNQKRGGLCVNDHGDQEMTLGQALEVAKNLSKIFPELTYKVINLEKCSVHQVIQYPIKVEYEYKVEGLE